jgi:hypothetical protein
MTYAAAIRAIESRHYPIKHLFFRGMGLKLSSVICSCAIAADDRAALAAIAMKKAVFLTRLIVVSISGTGLTSDRNLLTATRRPRLFEPIHGATSTYASQ